MLLTHEHTAQLSTLLLRYFKGIRLDYFIVGVTNSSAAPVRGCYALCGQYPSKVVNGGRHSLQCNPSIASGRYVIVQQPVNGDGYLTLCEVEVYAGKVRNSKSPHKLRRYSLPWLHSL